MGRTREGGSGARRVGGTTRYPSQYFWEPRAPRVEHLARQWGAQLAANETHEFIALLTEQSPPQASQGPIVDTAGGVVASMSSRGLTPTAIFVPSRGALLREMELGPAADIADLAGTEARRWNRGSFDGVPVFAVPGPERADIWVVDFRALGTWLQPGAFDELFVHSELLRTELVELDGALVPATDITAIEYFMIEIEDAHGAVGLQLPPGSVAQ